MKHLQNNRDARINARVEAMQAHRKSVRRRKAAPVVITGICAAALLAGGTVFGASMLNGSKTVPVQTAQTAQTVPTTVAAQNAANQNSRTRKTATVNSNSGSTQNTNTNTNTGTNTDTGYSDNTSYADNSSTATYDADTNSYSYSYSGDTDSYSSSDSSYTSTDSGSAQQTAYTGTHHSGATWDGTGSPLHFYENGSTHEGYNWRYEGGGGLVDLGCDYTFSGDSYDFSLIGKEPGSGSITVWHNTDDNTQVPTTINFTVDDDLNVTYD